MHWILSEINKLAFVIAPLFYKLLYLSLTASCIGLVILLIRRLADKKIPPVWKYVMWGLVLVALVLPYRPQSKAAVLPQAPIEEISFRQEYDEIRSQTHLALQSEETGPEEAERLQTQQNKLYWKSLLVDVVIPLFWLCGAVGLLGVFALSAWRLSRNIRRHTLPADSRCRQLLAQCAESLKFRRPVELISQDTIGSPAVTGLRKPKILLPAYAPDMSDENLRFILLHELSHLKRGDVLLNALLLLLQAVYWFNPLIWLLFRTMREDMELLNDAYVLRCIGQEQGKAYSRALLEVLAKSSRLSLAPKLLCMCDEGRNMERRIRMIKLSESFRKRKAFIALFCVLLMAAMAVLFLTQNGKEAEEFAENRLAEAQEEQSQPEPVPVELQVGLYHSLRLECPAYDLPSGQENEESRSEPFLLTMQTPSPWRMEQATSERMGDSQDEQWHNQLPSGDFPCGGVYLYDGEGKKAVGYIGISTFLPFQYEGLPFPSEDYYKGVFPELRLGSLCTWDPFHSVKVSESGEVGICDIYFHDTDFMSENPSASLAQVPTFESVGILAYDNELKVYIAIAFSADSGITKEQAEEMAKTLELVKKPDMPTITEDQFSIDFTLFEEHFYGRWQNSQDGVQSFDYQSSSLVDGFSHCLGMAEDSDSWYVLFLGGGTGQLFRIRKDDPDRLYYYMDWNSIMPDMALLYVYDAVGTLSDDSTKIIPGTLSLMGREKLEEQYPGLDFSTLGVEVTLQDGSQWVANNALMLPLEQYYLLEEPSANKISFVRQLYPVDFDAEAYADGEITEFPRQNIALTAENIGGE